MALIGGRSSINNPGLSASAIADDAGLRLGLAAIGVLVIFRIVLAATTNLAEDEAYYWLWSRHLAASYYDHPPMIAYWIRAGTAIFGNTEIGVRFVGLLSSFAGSYLLYGSSLILFRDRSAALLCVIWLNATLLLNAAAIVATPDTPLAFFTALTLFTLAKLVDPGRGAWWFGVGAALGFAFLSKYTAVLLLPCVFIWMAATPEGRRWFKRPEPYLAALLAMAIVAPVFYWNYVHQWASFAKQAEHSIKDTPANAILSVLALIGSQAGLVSPIVFAFCVFGSFYALQRGMRSRDPRLLLPGAIACPVLIFFTLHAFNQKIQPNWPGFIYPAAILAAVHGFLAIRKEKQVPAWIGESFRFAPWLAVSFTMVAFLQLGLGVLPIEAKKDPTARLKGWEKLGVDVDQLKRETGASRVLTDRYAITGELAFYSPSQQNAWQINERIRYANMPVPDDSALMNAPALLVLRKGGNLARASVFFKNARLVTTLKRDGGFHPRDAYDVYLLTGYRGGLFGQATQSPCGTATNQEMACN